MQTTERTTDESGTGRRPVLRFGLQIARFDYPGVGPHQVFDRVTDIARTAEEAGFDSIWAQDHFYQAPVPGIGWQADEPVLEPYTMLAALAARTSRVRLGTTVTGVTYRNPALLAKTVSTLDVISGGRAVLGIGAAWHEEEHTGYGYDYPSDAERLSRLEEALRICRPMFRDERPVFTGEYYRVDGAVNSPPPLAPGGPPILVGGSGEKRTLRLVARYADACNLFGDLDTVRHKLKVLDGHCETENRDPAEITRTKMSCLLINESDAEARRRYDEMGAAMGDWAPMLGGMAMAGSPDRIAEQVAEYFEAGLDGLVFYLPDTHDLDTVRMAGETLVKHFGGL
ncbi:MULTISPECIES: LLM class F420-dependent oxidoreductase [Streptomyces]|uniref:LLM class F420-dependent oxidoreductase n=1 Tax=Streptomyces xinghaiensis TaxID=1038928 RepID=A0A3M8F6X5_9ACTN|nr:MULTISPECIES: LLM class F420-dependent oxidoreductase [Streptomyces]PQM22793.1 TIGR03560 family F420-dependent LLM class oxidoreductase [Streptomyces xinghaiensis]RKM97963.1 LLM class F420-dependent oxidoreductase [Streptomyces xinghaiensis]RNC73899.1 LLM class F420-dependent oxidoreductase [Streptomyces xinghaiensis]